MHLSELKAAGRHPSLPLSLTLADAAGGADLQLLSLLRVLPGQRYVGAGIWRGIPVLAKLLVGSNAARQFQRELQGVKLLAEQGLTTPKLLADGLVEGEGGWLLFEFLDGAQSLADAWAGVEQLPALADEQQAVLGEALTAVAHMHRQGLWQEAGRGQTCSIAEYAAADGFTQHGADEFTQRGGLLLAQQRPIRHGVMRHMGLILC